MKSWKKVHYTALAFVMTVAATLPAFAADWASVIMYHRFGESKYPTTNISIDQFQAHVNELKTGGYTVLPLGQIVDSLHTGKALPDRAVALTIDDAYLSVYQKAWPILKKAELPFTVFVSTSHLTKTTSESDYMSWDQLKEMSDAGVYVGHHSANHAHLPKLSLEKVQSEILLANQAFENNLGFVPALFAYPYGEYGSDIKKIIAGAGFKAAFGQQSGVAYSGHDKFSFPRFAMNENYGSIGRLRLAANAMPLRVRNVTPTDNVLKKNPPAFGFSLDETYENLKQLTCYSSNQSGGSVPIQRLGDNRIEIRLNKAYQPGRGRINCTLPGPEGRFRWFGNLFYIPRK
ncbi:MAG: polysaccharide deacetylase family protein [Sneathiella sp.]|nr:polysaccharide deacetylase family protein [Sneathiella sp.]